MTEKVGLEEFKSPVKFEIKRAAKFPHPNDTLRNDKFMRLLSSFVHMPVDAFYHLPRNSILHKEGDPWVQFFD